MRKFWLFTLLLAALLLSACAPAATATTAPPTAAPTASPAAAQPTAALQGTGGTMQCTVASNLPTPVPENAARFASITEKDWVLGDPNAKITLLEYSDFM